MCGKPAQITVYGPEYIADHALADALGIYPLQQAIHLLL
jgi:hypothetical protein